MTEKKERLAPQGSPSSVTADAATPSPSKGEGFRVRYRLFKNVHGTQVQVTACPDLNALVRAAFRMGALYRMTPVEIFAQEEKKGKWLRTDAYPHHVYCSECYKTFITNDEWNIWADGDLPRNYCPNCGARMKGVSEDA